VLDEEEDTRSGSCGLENFMVILPFFLRGCNLDLKRVDDAKLGIAICSRSVDCCNPSEIAGEAVRCGIRSGGLQAECTKTLFIKYSFR
jgi:hypothetical protein